MMNARHFASLVCLVAVAGCESGTSIVTPGDLEARVLESAAWSGGTVRVRSADFAGRALPTVSIDGDTLTVTSVDDSTIAVRLPDGNGSRTLSVEVEGFVPFEDDVELYGYAGATTGPIVSGFLQVIDVAGAPAVWGAGATGLVLVDVRTGAITRQLPDSVHSSDCTQGVGPSVHAGRFLLWGKNAAGQCQHPWSWSLGATPARFDSVFGGNEAWAIAEIGPGGAISGADDMLYISSCSAGSCTDQHLNFMGGALTGITMGRDAGRAVLHNNHGFVVSTATGDTLYRVPSTGRVEDAVFSASQDTLYAVGMTGEVVAVGSAAGTLREMLDLSPLWPRGVGRHGGRGWLGVVAMDRPNSIEAYPHLFILDQATLDTVAVLRAPELISLNDFYQFKVLFDEAQNQAYVVATHQAYDLHAEVSRILRYRLVP